MSEPLPPRLPTTDRTRHRRLADQGVTERAVLDEILRAAFVCHLGVLLGSGPLVVPTVFGSDARTLYLHGSVASRSLVESPGSPVCVTVTHVDGLVLARSVFEHAVNYRSAMIHGVPRQVTDPDEKLHGLRMLSEHAAPGQWDYARPPSRKELAATSLLALSLAEASVKVRTGFADDGEDAGLPIWSGVLPLVTRWAEPIADPTSPAGLPPPPHVTARIGRS